MMARIFIICLLAGTAALAQSSAATPQKQPAPPPAAAQSSPAAPSLQKPEATPASVAPDQPVLTVRGVCPAETGVARKPNVPATSDCVITISRQQFDNTVNAFSGNQPVSQAQRRQLGQAYVELLTFSEAAKAAGVENTPAFAEVMRVIRLKTLSEFYRNQLAEQFRNPSQQEIEQFYNENAAKYEGAKLSRVYLPKNDPNPQAAAAQKEAYQKKVLPLADEIQARAAKGEAMEKLQKEVYTTLGVTAPPPSTDLSNARHGIFPPKLDQEIFSHKAGEVFRSDDGSGYTIYRVESRQQVPLESVKDEITRELARRKMEEKVKELTTPVHADFNESYFGPPAPAGGVVGGIVHKAPAPRENPK
jgi:parvulin-like peptidyl-prolyl cis-trans isomerase-like protein